MKNSPWTEMECFFAIWGYYQLDKDRNIVKSHLYEKISDYLGRTAKSVEYKIQNVSACDKRPREIKPISEMPNAQGLLRQMFDKYWEDEESIHALYSEYILLIEQGFDSETVNSAFKDEKMEFFIEEGQEKTSSTKSYKRSKILVEEARKYYSKNGFLYCSVCNFSTLDIVESKIIQIHHLEPIAELEGNQRIHLEEAIKKVRPVCPTCHVLIHSRKPIMDIIEAKNILKGINQRMQNLSY